MAGHRPPPLRPVRTHDQLARRIAALEDWHRTHDEHAAIWPEHRDVSVLTADQYGSLGLPPPSRGLVERHTPSR